MGHSLQWIAMLATKLLAMGTFRKFYLGRGLYKDLYKGLLSGDTKHVLELMTNSWH